MPESLVSIQENVFYNTSLSYLNLKENFTTLYSYSLASSNISQITFPRSIRNIYSYAFKNTSITSIIIPEGLTYLGGYAFCDTIITCMELPSSLQTIGSYAFQNCSVESLELKEGLVTLSDYAFYNSSIKRINIPSSVKQIGNYCFFNAPINSLVFPETANNVTIGKFAFAFLNHENITIPEGTLFIDQHSFRGICTSNISYPSTLNIGNWSFTDAFSDELFIPNNTEIINDYSFASSNIKKIQIPYSMMHIGIGAFMASAINETFIPNNTFVDHNAFDDCTELTYINISEKSIINYDVFNNCYSIKNITTYDDIRLEGYAFFNVTNVTISHLGIHDMRTRMTKDAFEPIIYISYVKCCYKSPKFCHHIPTNITSCEGVFNCFSYNKLVYRNYYANLATMFLTRIDFD
ncbi:surface antigen Bsp, putative [Trichomonas vaginalis G3]|uniref:Surface antigen Bsp, putative n=1 Tax=Trichomonas vaginalis (strain ATCC PRA-98 / G3) TaxID=412133 RepID=A2FL30_TRIV3|nr:leucine-rich repeats (6 copies)-containing protein [Trichomonas vaginalis G3]EAX94401.1 surface antigen Bsp, putative [Trichomonas vaginalis G3]KAI5493985.1 leucine-rich repeats (6 copies)-containing protein [Trichomonas vaginalis G3]|eukprot:XP_001307331.1 surface antigen Bsp [Trichomonas vaginalis G3]